MTRNKSAFLFFFLLTLSSCSKSKENVLVITDNIKLDKKTSADLEILATSVVGNLIFSPVLYVDSRLKPHNILAENLKIMPDNKVIEIKLREGIRFHDGKEFTARDMLPAVKRLKEDLVGNYGDMYKGLRADVIDRARLRLANDLPIFDINLFVAGISAYPSVHSEKLAGTGPFKFSGWLDNGVELLPNEAYFEGKPKIDRIIYLYEEDEKKRLNKLLSGEADLLVMLSPNMASFLEKDSRFHVKGVPSDWYTAMFFNTRSPLFKDKIVRKAVSMAIDRNVVIKKGLKGSGTKTAGPFQHGMSHGSESYEYRPKEAVRLLAVAGWKGAGKNGFLEKNGKRLRFRFYYDNGLSEYGTVADIIAQNLFEVGFEAEAIPASFDDLVNKYMKSGNYEAILAGRSILEHANFNTWHSSLIANAGGMNFSSYGNREVDALLEQLPMACDIEAKDMIYGRMQSIFEEEVPAVFLYNPLIYTAVNKRFKGAEDFVGNVYSIYKIKDWSVDENFK